MLTVKPLSKISRITIIKWFLLLTLWAAAFYPVYPELFSTWLNHPNNSHGILVPFISLYFFWEKRSRLSQAAPGSSIWGLIILIISMAFYIISLAGAVAFIARLMIVSSLAGLILFAAGKKIFKSVMFPVLYLFFMVPVPDSIISQVALPLQFFATTISAVIIKAMSIPVFQEGNMLYFAQTQLEVAEACSGIRSIASLTMLSVLFAYFSKPGKGKKVLLVASAVPIALLANIIRVTGTGILAHFYGDQMAQGFLHEFSGLAVFVFGFFILLGVFFLLNRKEKLS